MELKFEQDDEKAANIAISKTDMLSSEWLALSYSLCLPKEKMQSESYQQERQIL